LRRVLLVTTRSAQGMVSEIARSLRGRYDVDVFVSGAVVAQLASCEDLAVELRGRLGRCDYDVVLVPGLVAGSAKVVEEATGCKVYKGPKYAGDIPLALELLERGLELSREVPADDLLKEVFSADFTRRFGSIVSSKKASFTLGGREVFADPPPLLLVVEISASDRRRFDEKLLRATEAGFDGVVVGCSRRCEPGLIAELASRAKDALGSGIVGVDLPRVGDLTRDVAESVDLVLNVTSNDVDTVAHLISSDKGVVAIPNTVDSPEDALTSLTVATSRLAEVGIRKVIVDPLIRPPGVGFAESIVRFYQSRKSLSYPHLFSTANAYEMVDADSHGMVVLLVTTALELGASLVLATEESSKAFGAIEEHAIARCMAYSAYVRRSPPKDSPYGADLLVVKGKRLDPSTIPPVEAPALEVGTLEHVADPKYYVRIYVNHADEHLVVDVVGKVSGKPLARFLGREAISLARAVVRRFDLTPEHAAYLGYELGKAELALRFGKSYEQDSETVLSPRDKLRLLKDLTKSLNTVRSMVTG